MYRLTEDVAYCHDIPFIWDKMHEVYTMLRWHTNSQICSSRWSTDKCIIKQSNVLEIPLEKTEGICQPRNTGLGDMLWTVRENSVKRNVHPSCSMWNSLAMWARRLSCLLKPTLRYLEVHSGRHHPKGGSLMSKHCQVRIFKNNSLPTLDCLLKISNNKIVFRKKMMRRLKTYEMIIVAYGEDGTIALLIISPGWQFVLWEPWGIRYCLNAHLTPKYFGSTSE